MKDFNKKVVATTALTSIILANAVVPVLAYTKDETVYTKTKNDGSNYETIVSEHLKNTDNLDEIVDYSVLQNIENVNGDEEFSKNGNTLIWKANGNDIYYQGDTEKETPIEIAITYKLDGEEIDSSELAGKEGKLEIDLNFTNKEKHLINVNGKTETLYTPFAVMSGTLFDNDKVTNIEITNGKTVENGNKTIVVGMCMPGLKESLDLNSDKINIPENIIIKADIKDFEMGNIMTVATPKLLTDNDIDLDDFDKVFEDVQTLSDSSKQLVDGSKQLSDGAEKLNSGTNELANELNSKINLYYSEKEKLINKQEIEQKIINIINNELAKMMPNIKEEAKNEVSNVISSHKTELEQSTVNTVMKYTKQAESDKLEEIQKNGGKILSDADQKILTDEITKDIEKVMTDAQSNQQMQLLENSLKDAIKKEIENSVSDAASKAISQNLTQEKSSIKNAKLVNLEKNMTQEQKDNITKLVDNMEKGIIESTKEVIAKKMGTTVDKISNVNAQSAYLAQNKMSTRDAAEQAITALITSTMTSTLDGVEASVPQIAKETVDNTLDSISNSSKGTIEVALKSYQEAIVKDMMQELKISDTKIMNQMVQNMKNSIIEDLKVTLENDKTLQAYKSLAEKELQSSIDSIANSTAQELAEEYTETIATEVANNLIEKQLSGELKNSDVEKELDKYEEIINSKLDSVDSSLSQLKVALNQLTEGTSELSNGASQLSEGMTKFDEEGIKKIAELVNGDVKDFKTRVEKLKELSENYATIDETTEVGTETKFIIVTDEIKKQDDSKEENTQIQEIDSNKTSEPEHNENTVSASK